METRPCTTGKDEISSLLEFLRKKLAEVPMNGHDNLTKAVYCASLDSLHFSYDHEAFGMRYSTAECIQG
jgi:hypothetical protein